MLNLIQAWSILLSHVLHVLFVLVSSQLLSNDSFTVSQPPSPQPVEENSIDQGFHLFLNVLNKGVDVGLLRIVNDDPGDLCLDNKLHKIQQHEATDASFRERQYSMMETQCQNTVEVEEAALIHAAKKDLILTQDLKMKKKRRYSSFSIS